MSRIFIYLFLLSIIAVSCVQSRISGPPDKILKSKVVKLMGEHGMCSGEQIHAQSGRDYIISAAHCRKLAKNDSFMVIKEDGNVVYRRLIAEDPASDLILIEGLPGVQGLDMASDFSLADHVRTFTHGRNHDTYKTEGQLVDIEPSKVMIGLIMDESSEQECLNGGPKNAVLNMSDGLFSVKACIMSTYQMVTTAQVQPGSSGGLVVNDSGELVGVVSASDGAFGFLVTLSDIRKFVAGY